MKHIRMKELPSSLRPYERCIREGPDRLTDAELLSIIIRTGSRDENSLELAHRILALNYPSEGILGLLHLSLPQLMSVKGIGEVKGLQLLCTGELSRRIWKRKTIRKAVSFCEPEQVAAYYQEDLRHQKQEQFCMMMFNSKQNLIRDMMLSKGTVNASLAAPREIFAEALCHRAVSLILVHNHPSGDPEPSREDIALTKRIAEAGVLLGIPLLDHVVIGDNAYVSMKERGLL
ncbi:MAG: DNA repair protein RadC [Eubacteriales bacterium]|nr:DNA repair protein RadC [Eubacteriales bacterium]